MEWVSSFYFLLRDDRSYKITKTGTRGDMAEMAKHIICTEVSDGINHLYSFLLSSSKVKGDIMLFWQQQ